MHIQVFNIVWCLFFYCRHLKKQNFSPVLNRTTASLKHCQLSALNLEEAKPNEVWTEFGRWRALWRKIATMMLAAGIRRNLTNVVARRVLLFLKKVESLLKKSIIVFASLWNGCNVFRVLSSHVHLWLIMLTIYV